ncbi:MAG TPA: class I SAM-dependent methyltransferase [bacterium]
MADPIDQQFVRILEQARRPGGLSCARELVADYRREVAANCLVYGHRNVMKKLLRHAGHVPREQVRVLDYGCGVGATAFSLLALGYLDTYGVDLHPMAEQNRIARELFGVEGDRFFQYDGLTLPFPSGVFHFIYSEQVLEHVKADYLHAYYREGARVLAPGGACLHQVPHRSIPYDSHSQTWLIHYFPRALRRRLYAMIGRDAAYLDELLSFRSPGFHLRMLGRYYDRYEDVTLERVLDYNPTQFYDGPQRLRNLLHAFMRRPVLRRLIAPLLRYGVMLDTLAFRNGSAIGAGPGPCAWDAAETVNANADREQC